MALKFVLLCALVCVANARFPKSLQDHWGFLDTVEYNTSPRVVGGQDAPQGAAPFQISLLKNYLIMKSHMCGGSLIDSQVVVTAAHCTDGQKASSLNVRYGTSKRSSSSFPDLTIKKIVQHPGYDPNTIQNDISLLILSSPVKPSENVKTISLESEELQHDEDVKVYGWGLTDGNSQSLPENLQVGTMKVVGNDKCQETWGEVNAITPGMLCTLDKTQSACNGDSGGPLVSKNGKLAGIVSWGPSKCPTGTYMSVFTRVSYYSNWINENKKV